jgi:hypothetical protein
MVTSRPPPGALERDVAAGGAGEPGDDLQAEAAACAGMRVGRVAPEAFAGAGLLLGGRARPLVDDV